MDPAYDADGEVRDGAWVAEATGLTDLSGWPPGMRLVIRKERPYPGAQLRFTDRDGLRLTAFVTNTTAASSRIWSYVNILRHGPSSSAGVHLAAGWGGDRR
ncbi:hypothetical protein GCM10027262_61670 [Nocardia tengchongensis]